MSASYWLGNAGDFEQYRRLSIQDRYRIHRKISQITKKLRDGGTMTGHPKTDRRIG